jgi:hypothetical protein
MTELLAPHQKATHADAHAIYQAVIARITEAGWTRQAIDTLARPDSCWQIRHHYTAGVWELHFERQPWWRPGHQRASSVPDDLQPRTAKIDRHRPLPSPAAVLSELFGPAHAVCASPVPVTNGGGK